MNALTAAYRLDPEQEAFLERLNDALEPLERQGWRDLPERQPTLHVVGVPRSGTTLAIQLMARHLDVGYVNNLIAAFWKAPTVGIRLSRKLLRGPALPGLDSAYGRTAGIDGPHEFGRFWRELLGYADLSERGVGDEPEIDWQRVRRVLTSMTRAFDGPVVFKSFWLGMHMARVQAALPKTCFLRLRRDEIDNALSLLRMRREVLGSEEAWASMKPREYAWLKKECVPMQVAGQVLFLERMLDRQIASVAGHNVIEARYEDVCARPRGFLEQVVALLRSNGGRVRVESWPERGLEVLRPSRSAEPGVLDALRHAFERLRERA